MSGLLDVVRADLERADTAHALAGAALMEFNAHCRAYAWPAAEEARQKVIGHMEAYLDHMAATYKALERDGHR